MKEYTDIFIIDNSKEVLNRLHKIYKTSQAKSFDSYDFATWYTQEALENNIRTLIREAFKIRGAKYLIVDTHGKAHWSQIPSLTTCVTISKSRLMDRLPDRQCVH